MHVLHFIIHSSVDGHLGGFQIVAIMTNAANHFESANISSRQIDFMILCEIMHKKAERQSI